MTDIEKAVRDYNKYVKLVKEKEKVIFTKENIDKFKNQILDICQEIIVGRNHPTTCFDKYSIPFGLIEEIDDYPFESYYGKYIEWSVSENNKIIAEIEAVVNGGIDSEFRFDIPANEDEYKEFLLKLKGKGINRLKRFEAEEEKERKLFEKLKLKFDTKLYDKRKDFIIIVLHLDRKL